MTNDTETLRGFLRLVFARSVEAAVSDDEVVALCRAYNRMKRQVGT